MLPFQKAALLDVSSVDGKGTLLVVGRGLGLNHILAGLLQVVGNPHGLVLVLGLHDTDTDYLSKTATIQHLDANTCPTRRQECYQNPNGGIVACTARVLLVDLLQGRLHADRHHIAGIIIHRADEHLEEHGMVAFILAIIHRQQPSAVFVKALTERPEQLTSGFAGLERAMRTLHLQHASFYPRFHNHVRTDLDGASVDVVEVKVRLTRDAKAAQVFLMDLLTRSVKHLLNHNTAIDGDSFPVDLALSGAFERRLLQVLDLNYRAVDSVTAECMQEIRTWRHLLFLNVNCVRRRQFNEAVVALFNEACKDPRNVPSWVSIDSADLLLRHCKNHSDEINPKLSTLLELRYEEDDLMVVTGNEAIYEAMLLEASIDHIDQDSIDQDAIDQEGDKQKNRKRRRRGGRLRVVLSDTDDWVNVFKAEPDLAICLTDLTLEAIRQIEVAAASTASTTTKSPRRVYYLMFTESAEEQRYLAGLRREKDAFEQLIRTYGDMPEVVSVNDTSTDTTTTNGRYSALIGDSNDHSEAEVITVDVRELRSALPFVLYKRNYTILPMTLLTGDYIPSTGVVVERKTIADLTQSLNNGRLLAQTERMLADYATACLLVELDSFKVSPWRDDLLYVIGKLSVLLHHRPALRLLWAGGPGAGADLLHDLTRVSSDTGHQTPTPGYSTGGRNALLGFRGIVDERNVAVVMESFSSLRDLFTASRERLRAALGDTGDKLYDAITNNTTNT